MKKKVILAVVLSMLAVASTSCALVEDIADAFDSVSSSSSDTRDEDDEEDEEEDKDEESKSEDEDKDEDSDKDSDNKASLSDILNFNKEDKDEEVELPTESEDQTESEVVIAEPATSIVDGTKEEVDKLKDKLEPSENNILYDDAGLKITYNNFEKEFDLVRFNMTFENTSDIPLVVQAWEVYINGIEVDAIMSVGTETGNTIEDAMKFYIDDLEEVGISMSDIETVEVSFHIFDWDGRVESLDTELIKFQA